MNIKPSVFLTVALSVFFTVVLIAAPFTQLIKPARAGIVTFCVEPRGTLSLGPCNERQTPIEINNPGPAGPQGPAGPEGPTGSFSVVINRDTLVNLTGGGLQTGISLCQAGEKTIGGSVNIIPDGTGGLVTSRPVGNEFDDSSPDNGSSPAGWLGAANGMGLMVVHAFCAR